MMAGYVQAKGNPLKIVSFAATTAIYGGKSMQPKPEQVYMCCTYT